ncbi:MAG: Gldg family protein [Phycisphaerae bacterium]
MNRTPRLILAVVFIGIIMFSAISISQNLFKAAQWDVTDQKLYSLSDGTMAILAKLNQPVKMKLYYTKTAAMKGPDQIRYFNNYYNFVQSILEQYAAKSGGMVTLDIIDPRPFTQDEADVMRYGLRRIPMTQEENFIFGLVLQTQFGVTKTIEFFSPERQSFIEYDISSLIDSAIRRQKNTFGVISSLAVMGDDLSPYMIRMMQMQNRPMRGPWTIIEHLRQKYEVQSVADDVSEINDIDLLLVIHPKDLPETTLFAIDQFVLKGGRAIVLVDPFCFADQPSQQQMYSGQAPQSGSNLELLMNQWGLRMPNNNFVGDPILAELLPWGQNQSIARVIAIIRIVSEYFNRDLAITANLNEVRVAFAGALKEIPISSPDGPEITRTALISTSPKGNTFTVETPYELMNPNPQRLMQRFTDGIEPVIMGYLVTGKFKSAFPSGIEIKDESDPNAPPQLLTGLTQAQEDCAVIVFSDVDFITDALAYQNTFFGRIPLADNAAMLMNAVDELGGSAELISIRSRGTFSRPFLVVDRIEALAEESTAQQERAINAEISSFQQELNNILASAKEGQEEVIGSAIVQKKNELELKILDAQMRLRDVKMNRRQSIEHLGNRLRNLNTLPGPVIILLIAVLLGIYRVSKKRRYISHASDA